MGGEDGMDIEPLFFLDVTGAKKLDTDYNLGLHLHTLIYDCKFRIFPLHHITRTGKCSCGDSKCKVPGKHPRIKKYALNATHRQDKACDFWTQFLYANIGILTGKYHLDADGKLGEAGFVAVDVDGEAGKKTLREWEARNGPLPKTWKWFTGRGFHLIFKYPKHLFHIPCRTGFIGPHVDLRADGGYVVGPGSTHISGKRYEWDWHNSFLNMTYYEVPELPGKFIEALSLPLGHGIYGDRKNHTSPGQAKKRYVNHSDGERLPPFRTIPVGMRNSTMVGKICHYRDIGLSKEQVTEIALALRRDWYHHHSGTPEADFPETEVLKIVEWAYEKAVRRHCRENALYDDEGPMQVWNFLTKNYGFAWAECSKSLIAQRLSMSDRNVSNCLRRLEDFGLLETELRAGRKSRYRAIPKIDDPTHEEGVKGLKCFIGSSVPSTGTTIDAEPGSIDSNCLIVGRNSDIPTPAPGISGKRYRPRTFKSDPCRQT